MTAGAGPGADLEGCRRSHRGLLETLQGLADGDQTRQSRLPGWTVGHVLTHLARNADSHLGILEAAARGEVADQYPGGAAQRSGDIEAGAGRGVEELVADVTEATARLEACWDVTTADVWQRGRGRMAFAGSVAVVDLPFMRWREVEVHHADLGLGYGPDDWPEAYVEREVPLHLSLLAGRLPPGVGVELRAADTGESWVVPPGAHAPDVVTAPRRQLLAWLVGREELSGAPTLGPWQ